MGIFASATTVEHTVLICGVRRNSFRHNANRRVISRTKLAAWLTVALHNEKGRSLVLRCLAYWVLLNGMLVAVRVARAFSVRVTLAGSGVWLTPQTNIRENGNAVYVCFHARQISVSKL